MTAISTYLAALSAAFERGDATEHTHRPALKALLESVGRDIVATNEPRRIACGAPDFVISKARLTVGYLEAKDIGVPLDEALRTEQLARYTSALDNLIVTDYLEFRWFADGELRLTARLAEVASNGKIRKLAQGEDELLRLLGAFFDHTVQDVRSPRELAERMARLTHIIRDIIVAAFENNEASDWLKGWRKAFTQVLIADLDQPQRTSDFADMFAQTLSYGLFTARVMDDTPRDFSRSEAQRLIPRSNPFLRNFFMDISNPRVDEEPFASFVDDLVALLAHTDMQAVLADFGRRTRQEDPVVHFYETFLAAYDPELREKRGVYYTPEPVVSYIVQSVDEILKRDFDCPRGLADETEVTVKNFDASLRVKGKPDEMRKTVRSHRVLILDPAVGTGTFLYNVIDGIRQQFIDANNAGLWQGYVSRHLLPRLFGFEFMVAPYAVAHFKLSLQLMAHDLPEAMRDQWAYRPRDQERLGIYLTNTLDEAHPETPMPLFTQYVADESNAADEVKLHRPVLVVMGNPPYSGHSSNHGEWISDLQHGLVDGVGVQSYYEVDGEPLGEQNPKWLKNDYAKFLCFGQWRIERNGEGILAFITDHGYLDNPTFRGMRQSLMRTFSDIYVLDLHGGSKKKERAPDGGRDVNVFDIQQGVSIGIFIKRKGVSGPATVRHSELWGERASKYTWLQENTQASTQWQTLEPRSPFYLFRPQNVEWFDTFQNGWKLTDIFPINVLGFQTHRDHFAVAFDRQTILQRATELRDAMLSDSQLQERHKLKDNRDWQIASARTKVRADQAWQSNIVKCLYRPFDVRHCYFSNEFMDYPRRELLDHVKQRDNLCLLSARQQATVGFRHAWVSALPAESCAVSSTTREQNYVFPLYLYPNARTNELPLDEGWVGDPENGNRIPNLKPQFVDALSLASGLAFNPLSTEAAVHGEFSAKDVAAYIYSIMSCPSYRTTFSEYLKMDFPRIPLPASGEQFVELAQLGHELIALHTMQGHPPALLALAYPVAGANRIAKRHLKHSHAIDQPVLEIANMPSATGSGRVYLNADQYVEGVPTEVWEFQVGGFQPAKKWLSDRADRDLSYTELTDYQGALQRIARTLQIYSEIDELIPSWPIS